MHDEDAVRAALSSSARPRAYLQRNTTQKFREAFDLLIEDFDHSARIPMTFNYKGRTTEGSAIHVASLHPEGTELVRKLLESRADPESKSTQVACKAGGLADPEQASQKTHLPIHMAASIGNVHTCIALLEYRADITAMSTITIDGKPRAHYAAIHEAAYFDRAEVVHFLCERHVDPDERNRNGQTALHICAKMDSFRTARVLNSFGANVTIRDEKGNKRALDYALEGSSAAAQAYHFTERKISDVINVAEEDVDCAARLMKDSRAHKGEKIHRSWQNGLLHPEREEDRPCVDDFLKLLRLSPAAAADLLEILTVRPDVTRRIDYSLPRSTVRLPYERMRCEYRPETQWEQKDTAWHKGLVPDLRSSKTDQQRQVPSRKRISKMAGIVADPSEVDRQDEGRVVRDQVPVRVQLLKLAGKDLGKGSKLGVIFNERLLYDLAETDHKHIFKKEATQAILDFTWVRLARKHYIAGFVIRMLDLLALCFVVVRDADGMSTMPRMCWVWCAATGFREMHIQLLQWIAYWRLTQNPLAYIACPQSRYALLSLLLTMLLIGWTIGGTMELGRTEAPHPHLLCVVCLLRWAHVIFMLHAYRYMQIGYELVPVIESFFKVFGIALILCVSFVAFTHAFLALNLAAGESSLTGFDVALGALRLLTMQDGDGINMAVALGSSTGQPQMFGIIIMMLGVLIVCICVLNIFIAVHGDQYQMAKATVLEDFYLMRARTCLHTLFDALTVGPVRRARLYAMDLACPKRSCLPQCCLPCLRRAYDVLPREGSAMVYIVVVLPNIALWLACVRNSLLHPILAAVLLALALRWGDQHLLLCIHTESEEQGNLSSSRTVPFDSDGPARTQTISGRRLPRPQQKFVWWASWDMEDADPDYMTSIAQEVHETKMLMRRSQPRPGDVAHHDEERNSDIMRRLRQHEELLLGLQKTLDDLRARLPDR